MRVKVTKDFLWAGEDGNHVRTVKAGTEVEGRAAEVALQVKCGEESRGEQPKPTATSQGKGK